MSAIGGGPIGGMPIGPPGPAAPASGVGYSGRVVRVVGLELLANPAEISLRIHFVDVAGAIFSGSREFLEHADGGLIYVSNRHPLIYSYRDQYSEPIADLPHVSITDA